MGVAARRGRSIRRVASSTLDRVRLSAHVDVFRRDPDTGEQTLVSTTRPCCECGYPLDGLVVPVGDEAQAHPHCLRTKKVIHGAA